MPRPTDLTPEMSARICERIRAGVPKKHAAVASGTTEASFHRWYRAGEAETEDSDSIHRKFYDDINQARAEGLQRYITLHAQNANGYDAIKTKTRDVVAYREKRYKDERGNMVIEREPVKMTLSETERSTERDTKAPMDYLKRQDREEFGDHLKQEIGGINGDPIEINAPAIDQAQSELREWHKEMLEVLQKQSTGAPSS